MSIISKLLPVLGTAFGMQALGFSISAPFQTERFYDLTGATTYAMCVAISLFYGRSGSKISILNSLHIRQLVVSGTTFLWCSRLGSFLLYRVMKDGSDKRFDKVKTQPKTFGYYWLMQGVWVFLTAFPVYVINVMPASRLASFGIIDLAGLGIWISGFAFESIADYQKLAWQNRIGHEERKTNFINEGVWTLSRHPNYFGEIMLWTGNFMICASAVRNMGFVGLGTAALFSLSPLFVSTLLIKVSGIPLLEKSSDKKFGHLESYQKYKQQVPVLIPNLFSKSKLE